MKKIKRLVLSNLIILKNGSNAKKTYVDCTYNKFFLDLVYFLYKKNLILGYTYVEKYKIRIFLKYYKNKGLFDNLQLMSMKSSSYSYNSLMYVYEKIHKSALVIILTNKGYYLLSELMTSHLRMGGAFVCTLYL